MEKSCGAVVLSGEGYGSEVLLIQSKHGRHWGFPKGHMEEGETEQETACREIREETGIQVQINTAFRTSVYYHLREGISKEVVYFLCHTAKQEMKMQVEEIRDLKWVPLQDVLKTLTFRNDRRVMRQALRYLQEAEGLVLPMPQESEERGNT